ncbi:MAG: hypothetical protein FD161_4983, partial [Limisphaerales bacterium]
TPEERHMSDGERAMRRRGYGSAARPALRRNSVVQRARQAVERQRDVLAAEQEAQAAVRRARQAVEASMEVAARVEQAEATLRSVLTMTHTQFKKKWGALKRLAEEMGVDQKQLYSGLGAMARRGEVLASFVAKPAFQQAAPEVVAAYTNLREAKRAAARAKEAADERLDQAGEALRACGWFDADLNRHRWISKKSLSPLLRRQLRERFTLAQLPILLQRMEAEVAQRSPHRLTAELLLELPELYLSLSMKQLAPELARRANVKLGVARWLLGRQESASQQLNQLKLNRAKREQLLAAAQAIQQERATAVAPAHRRLLFEAIAGRDAAAAADAALAAGRPLSELLRQWVADAAAPPAGGLAVSDLSPPFGQWVTDQQRDELLAMITDLKGRPYPTAKKKGRREHGTKKVVLELLRRGVYFRFYEGGMAGEEDWFVFPAPQGPPWIVATHDQNTRTLTPPPRLADLDALMDYAILEQRFGDRMTTLYRASQPFVRLRLLREWIRQMEGLDSIAALALAVATDPEKRKALFDGYVKEGLGR